MRAFLASLLLLVVSSLAACGDEAKPRTELIVAMNADADVMTRVKRLEVRVYQAQAVSPGRIERFALVDGAGEAAGRRVQWPISFHIAQRNEYVLRLEVLGFDDLAPESASTIEHKVLVRFAADETAVVTVRLASSCLDRAGRCATLDVTCTPEDARGCAPVSEGKLDPTAPVGVDAGTETAIVPPPPAPLASCSPEQTQTCPLPESPCVVSDDGQGYSCRGQYAAWPMPDAEPGAKTPPKYSVRAAEGVVLDEVTGLLWQRELPRTYPGCTGLTRNADTLCKFREAIAYCDQLTLAGLRWRLPTKIELESLLHPRSAGAIEARIDLDAFPGTTIEPVWSITRQIIADASYDDYFVVQFGMGASLAQSSSKFARARCVHSDRNPNAPPSKRYEVDPQGRTIRDAFTGLVWEAGASAAVVTATEARARCTSWGGRVPTLKELLSLTGGTAEVDQQSRVFPKLAPNQALRASTAGPGGLDYLYIPAFAYTAEDGVLGTNARPHVRCVR